LRIAFLLRSAEMLRRIRKLDTSILARAQARWKKQPSSLAQHEEAQAGHVDLSLESSSRDNICSSPRTRFIIVRQICTTDPSSGAGSNGIGGRESAAADIERIHLEVPRHAPGPDQRFPGRSHVAAHVAAESCTD